MPKRSGRRGKQVGKVTTGPGGDRAVTMSKRQYRRMAEPPPGWPVEGGRVGFWERRVGPPGRFEVYRGGKAETTGRRVGQRRRPDSQTGPPGGKERRGGSDRRKRP